MAATYCTRIAMNKAELVDVIASKTNVTKKEADTILNAITETIVEVVSGGDKISLVGFGSFERRERQAKEGRNPKTGEKMQIRATRVPAFAAGKLFKDKVAPND
nr:HU family DNA-binding protein [Chroococcidiopsis cubana]